MKLSLALGVAKYIKSYKINFVVQYATDYCPLEHDNYKTISAHLGSPISCYINNLHGAFIFLLSVFYFIYFSGGGEFSLVVFVIEATRYDGYLTKLMT